MRTGDRDSAVAGQPLLPFFVTGPERLFYQQPSKSRSIDKQLTFDAPLTADIHRPNKAALRVQLDVLDLAFKSLHTQMLGIPAQIRGIQRRIEMICIVEVVLRMRGV